VGEVAVRGPNVMLGYWNQPGLTAAAVRDGWMHTGDGGRMDEEGYLFIVDRMKDMIVSGGENVYSAEVENALSLHPAVAASAVIGVPSEPWGEAVHAVVVLKPGREPTREAALDILRFLRQRLAPYKRVRRLEFAELPKTISGKIRRVQLRQAEEARRAQGQRGMLEFWEEDFPELKA